MTLRLYFWAIYLACVGLVAAGANALLHQPLVSTVTLEHAVLFVLMAYVSERITLPVSNTVGQSLCTSARIASILLFAPPFPTFITLIAAGISQMVHGQGSRWKRAFDVCHAGLTVAGTVRICALVAPPDTVLQPGHVGTSVPMLALILCVYYVLDVGLAVVGRALQQRAAPWRVWWETHRATLLPELSASTIGMLAAVAWRFDPILVLLSVLPVAALRVAFRAIAQATDRAAVLERRSQQLEAVLAAGQRLKLHHTRSDLLMPVAEAARSVLEASTVTAYLPDEEDPIMLKRVVQTPPGERGGPPLLLAPEPGQGVKEYVDDRERTLLVPLEIDGTGLVGALLVGGVAVTIGHDDRDALAVLATQSAIALQNAHLHGRALAQASQDGLTGLLNHRAFQTRLEEEVARSRRHNRPLALMMLDLDDFSAINNMYGHQAGDGALLAVARVLRETVRSSDVVARYGGDEFVVILPEMDIDEATPMAERVLASVKSLAVHESGVAVRIDVSVGVAALPEHASTRDGLIRAADQAAYGAKHAGKGRVGQPEGAALPLDRDPTVLAEQLQHANMATVEALAAAVDAKDAYTRGHSQRVSAYAAALADALELSDADVARVRLAGLLHDVGKIGIPDAVLMKSGKLTDEEYAILQQHSVIGEHMLSSVPFLNEILPAVRHHHERWDGQGYPDRLAGVTIPSDAAILTVADSFDAMTSSRTYRPALPLPEARRRLREGAGVQFDPRVVEAFERALANHTLMPVSPDGTRVLNRPLPQAS